MVDAVSAELQGEVAEGIQPRCKALQEPDDYDTAQDRDQAAKAAVAAQDARMRATARSCILEDLQLVRKRLFRINQPKRQTLSRRRDSGLVPDGAAQHGLARWPQRPSQGLTSNGMSAAALTALSELDAHPGPAVPLSQM